MDLGQVGFAGLGRGDVENLAGFVEGEAGAGEGGGTGAICLVCSGEFLKESIRMSGWEVDSFMRGVLVMLRPACMPLRKHVRRRGRR